MLGHQEGEPSCVVGICCLAMLARLLSPRPAGRVLLDLPVEVSPSQRHRSQLIRLHQALRLPWRLLADRWIAGLHLLDSTNTIVRTAAGRGGLNNHARMPFLRDQVALNVGDGSGWVDLDPRIGQ